MTAIPQAEQPTTPPSGYNYAPSPQAPRKRRRWPWIVGGIVLLLIVIAGISGGGAEPAVPSPAVAPAPAAAPAPAPAPAAPAPALPAAPAPAAPAPSGEILYTITSEGGGTALITYSSDDKFNIAQENGASLPWRKTVDMGGGLFGGGAMATLSAQGDESATSISCFIHRDGEVISENTSTGQYAVVTCSGS